MASLPTSLVKNRPPSNGAYYTASVLYNAGFRGWPLTVMTAISGRESSWNPKALNNDPATGDYSAGLFQINYFGDLLQSRSAEFGSPQYLLSNPDAQAAAAYQLAGGNSLSGLGNWNMSASPANGVLPTPLSDPSRYTIAPYLAQAAAAAAAVGTFGPAPASATGQVTAWPGSSGSPAVATGGYTTAAALSGGGASTGCNTKGSQGNGVIINLDPASKIPIIGGLAPSANFTYCQLKALTGALIMVSGGVIAVIGGALLVAGAGLHKLPAPAAAAVGYFGGEARERRAQSQVATQRDIEAAGNPRRRGSASSQQPKRTRLINPDDEYDDYLRRTGETQF